MRVYVGIDSRSPVSYNVLQWSITRRTSKPVAIIPLVLPTLPVTRRGLTDFTFSRYIPPALCGYQGTSLFLDSDMLMLGDVAELFDLMDGEHSVYVVKNKQRFEWPSVMLFNNEKCRQLTGAYINDERNAPQSFEWAESVGELPPEWNHLVGYDELTEETPKLLHYTAGVPAMPETRSLGFADLWLAEHESMNDSCCWLELMGDSVHSDLVLGAIQEARNARKLQH